MTKVRIYKPAKSAMQSGQANTEFWHLEFEPEAKRTPDPLMGWVGSGDTQQQVQLKFASADDALAYAARHGIAATVHATPTKALKIQAYADNFR